MSTNTQPRQPSGTPTGGQFTGKTNPESEVVLGYGAAPPTDRCWQRVDDIVAYSYHAEIMCPSCAMQSVPTPSPTTHSAESALDIAAMEMGIDRYDENSFDSSLFPKVVFRDQLEGDDICGSCGASLGL